MRGTAAAAYRASLSERDLQASIEEEAARRGWLSYHTRRSLGSPAGFPDLTLARLDPERPGLSPARLVFAELKSAGGVVAAEQTRWLALLRRVPGIEVYVWTPDDWFAGAVEEVLR